MINEEISKEAGQAAQTIISYTIKAAKESINLEKESIIEKIKEYKQDSDKFNKKRQMTKDYYKNQER